METVDIQHHAAWHVLPQESVTASMANTRGEKCRQAHTLPGCCRSCRQAVGLGTFKALSVVCCQAEHMKLPSLCSNWSGWAVAAAEVEWQGGDSWL